jgi:predicted anti-sigma-YlaC factor YlaD
VTYAENACVISQDRGRFKDLLQRALAVNTDAQPENRLANLVAQRRALWLLGRMDELFLESAADDSKSASAGVK